MADLEDAVVEGSKLTDGAVAENDHTARISGAHDGATPMLLQP